ncbi:MAG: hypothetical protein AB7O29_13415, partial [Acidimicrobiia bacterium]
MKRNLRLVVLAAVLVVAATGAGLWWFLRDDAPDAVALSTAVESVEDGEAGRSDDPATGTAGTEDVGGIEGTWAVDSTTGDFDFEKATGTFAGFRIAENLAGIGSTTAVGRTGDVEGSISIEGTTLTDASFQVDVTGITTNESRRDDKVQQALES